MAAQNYQLPTQDVSWLTRDQLLFAVSIGIGVDELNFVFEQNGIFEAFPTYPTILPFKLTDQEIVDFGARFQPPTIPGAPTFRSVNIVDGGRTITFYRPIPSSSANQQFQLKNRILGVYDRGSVGSVIEDEKILVDAETGQEYVRMVGLTYYMGQGNWGGPNGPLLPSYPPPKDKAPDAQHMYEVPTNAALIYRLNGDYNRLHVTREPGKSLGFGGPVMHGLYTYNCAAHAVLKEVGASRPANLRELSARFSSPVRLGDVLVTKIWKLGTFQDEYEEIRFVTYVKGKAVLTNGRALVRPSSSPHGKF